MLTDWLICRLFDNEIVSEGPYIARVARHCGGDEEGSVKMSRAISQVQNEEKHEITKVIARHRYTYLCVQL